MNAFNSVRWRSIGFLRIFPALACLLWFGALASRAAITTNYVAHGGQTPSGSYTTWDTAASNIQDAISVATGAGSIVLVSNGVYDTGGVTNWPAVTVLTNRVAITNAITVRSANNDPANTIIKGAWNPVTTNGPAAVRCVYMVTNSSLIGFMLTNGATLQFNYPATGTNNNHHGGGIYVADSALSATISNCVIVGNSAAGYGGGAYYGACFNCTLRGNSASIFGGGTLGTILSNSTIACNSAGGGGGVYGATLYNCLVISNTAATTHGGGTYYSSLYNCTVAYNVCANYGAGAMYPGLARNCLFYGNQSFAVCLANNNKLESCTIVGSTYGFSQTAGGPQTNNILNCIIYSNQTWNWQLAANSAYMFTNTCTTPTNSVNWNGNGNTTNNPILVDFGTGYGTNHVKGNYRLQASSPCVNAGVNQSWMTDAVDLDGMMRIRYGIVDMGAYERIHNATFYRFH